MRGSGCEKGGYCKEALKSGGDNHRNHHALLWLILSAAPC